MVMNRILGFKDPVLCDAFVCSSMGYSIEDVSYIPLAERLGVGSSDPHKGQRHLSQRGSGGCRSEIFHDPAGGAAGCLRSSKGRLQRLLRLLNLRPGPAERPGLPEKGPAAGVHRPGIPGARRMPAPSRGPVHPQLRKEPSRLPAKGCGHGGIFKGKLEAAGALGERAAVFCRLNQAFPSPGTPRLKIIDSLGQIHSFHPHLTSLSYAARHPSASGSPTGQAAGISPATGRCSGHRPPAFLTW